MRNKEEEAEALAQFQRYAITGISKPGEMNPVTGVPGWIVIDPSAGTDWAGEVQMVWHCK